MTSDSDGNHKIDRDITEAMGLYYVAAELSRRDWRVFLPVTGRVKGYDIVAWKGSKSRRVEVKALRRSAPFAWIKPLENDVLIVGVRALRDKLPEFYVGTADEVNEAIGYEDQLDWKPWQNSERWLNKWDKFERGS